MGLLDDGACASCRCFMEWPRRCRVCGDEFCDGCFGSNGACEDCEEEAVGFEAADEDAS